MAENVTSVVSSDTGKTPGSLTGVVAPPKFVFGQHTTGRVIKSSAEDDDEEDTTTTRCDAQKGSCCEGTKRPASSEDDKQDSDSEKEGCLSPVKKVARLQKDFLGSSEHREENKFKLKPSMLNEVAKNLTSLSNKGEKQVMSSLIPKTVGAATADSVSTDNKREGTDTCAGFGDAASNYFHQFMQSGRKSPASSSSGDFVFGQNMGARVLFSVSNESEEKENTDKQTDKTEDAEVAGLALCKEDPKTLAEVAESCSGLSGLASPTHEKEHHSLAEAALAYQENVNPYKGQAQLDYVDVVNGEEEERNVLQVNCRLFVYDTPNHSWREKGRGVLRLNDMCQSMSEGIFQSRLVMRTRGSLRVVLNTKLWPQMTMERANEKSLRITAFDCDNEIKIYLVMAAPKEIQQLWTAIDRRIQALKRSQETFSLPNSPDQESPADQQQPKTTTTTMSGETGDKPNSPQIHSSVNAADEDSNDSCERNKVGSKEVSSDEE